MKLDEFLAKADHTWAQRNAWCTYSNGPKKLVSVYLRKYERCHREAGDIVTQLDIANVTAAPKGVGSFTAMLDMLEPKYGIYVENVVHERFAAFLRRRGYQDVTPHNVPSYPWCLARAQTTAKIIPFRRLPSNLEGLT